MRARTALIKGALILRRTTNYVVRFDHYGRVTENYGRPLKEHLAESEEWKVE
jgi:hypothetical protein